VTAVTVTVVFIVRCQVGTQKVHVVPGPTVTARNLRHAKRGRAEADVTVEPSSPQSSAVSPSEAKPPTKSKKYVQLAML